MKNLPDSLPLVSICCITYNHEKFISQALDGFLMQQTNFSFEIVIHDDASTDNTANIIKQYAEKYPTIFNALLQTENQRSKYKSGMNPRFNFPRSKGKYIALCEGDDYWTDPLKLQKQVDFLEANPDFNICFHNAKILSGSEFLQKKIYPPNRKENITLIDLLSGDFTKNCCSVFRYKKDMFVNRFTVLQDTTIFMICLEDGAKAHYINEDMAVYRIHEGGVWGLKSIIQKLASRYQIYSHLLGIYQKKEYNDIIKHKLLTITTELSFFSLKEKKWNEFIYWHKKSYPFISSKIFTVYYYALRKIFINKRLFYKSSVNNFESTQ